MITQNTQSLDIQGHRGCRGLYPENTIPAFIHAIKLGVHTLEMDVVISKDNKVIVSHEPFMNHEISLTPNGDTITSEEENTHNLYQLTYEEIKSYDTGTKFNEKFPHQVKVKTHKPSLSDLVEIVEPLDPKILYNIEIKRKNQWDNSFHPDYKTFADIVINNIAELGIMPRTTVQCFDIETLRYIHTSYPEVKLVYLVANTHSTQKNMKALGFVPYVYSPYFIMVNEEMIAYCKTRKIKVIPWTVNEIVDMKSLIRLEVDGIITDYPDRLIQLYQNINK